MKKIAVVLFNLGGPDSKNAIEPFLMNFFMDKNIIRLPVPFRCILAKMISSKRSRKEAGESYHELGDRSPLLTNTRYQSQELEKNLNMQNSSEFKTFVCMRYWHPMADQVVRSVRDWCPDQVILLPLYPQFSTTTTWSSLETWKKASRIADYHPPTSMVCCYPWQDGFIQASAENIRAVYDQALQDGHENPRILFSAHGLPESVIKDGDPYQWQCEQTAEKIADRLKIENLDWQICYQSRVGPKKWIGPSTEDAIKKAREDNKAIVIYPHAFTQEHVETLVELDIEYKEIADEIGLTGYYRAKTVGTHPSFIQGLADMVLLKIDKNDITADTQNCLCPEQFGRCCMRMDTSPFWKTHDLEKNKIKQAA